MFAGNMEDIDMAKIIPFDEEMKYAELRYEEFFADPIRIPVCFTLDGKIYRGFGDDFEVTRELLPAGSQVGTEFDGLRSYRSLSDYGEKITAKHPSGITAVVKTAVYKEYATFEWAVTFKNEGDSNSPVLSDISAANIEFVGRAPYLQHFVGDDNADRQAMMPMETILRRGMAVEFQPLGGRPTNFQLPFYRLSAGECSTVISVGWAGQWKARFDTFGGLAQNRYAADGSDCKVQFTAGQAEFDAYLLPGEEIRTPMITLLFAEGRADDKDGELRLINLWRRFLVDCNMRRIQGELMQPVAAGTTSWVNHEMVNSTDENQIAALDVYKKYGMQLDCWWMDAGWYFKNDQETIGDWPETGSWLVDTNRFPSEFKAVSDHAANMGTKTLLWFEPERVCPGTFLAEKQEWIVTPIDYVKNDAIKAWNSKHLLADMGNAAYREWMQERVFSVLEKGGISLYRQDYNINPLPHWQAADGQQGPYRKGICENHYVTGYLAYWDAIINRFPDVMIDSCASGGRRNDLETMRRSIAIHKTDADYSDFNRKQAMHLSFYQWLPYIGTLVNGPGYKGNPDKYAYRSANVSWCAFTYDVRKSAEENEIDAGLAAMAEWRDTNMFYYGDFYPLTEWSCDEDKWIGWEFYDEEKQGGILQFFRREENEETERVVKVYGVDADKNYLVHDYDTNCETVMTGQSLAEQGIVVKIPDKRSSALIKFTVCK